MIFVLVSLSSGICYYVTFTCASSEVLREILLVVCYCLCEGCADRDVGDFRAVVTPVRVFLFKSKKC